jgi:putative flippase GtrA
METKKTSSFRSWKESHAGFWQFVLFMLMSGLTTLVDLGTFALFNFWILAPYRGTPFFWGPFCYGIESGGLTAFGAFAVSFAVSQTFNFFLQRKTTFKANNNAVVSAILYTVMVIGVYFVQLYLPTLLRAPLAAMIGFTFGDLAMKLINMTVSMLIQFPLNKYVIMRNR